MRRLLRILISGLTILSLLLCVATCVLWVRSHRVFDSWTWSPDKEKWNIWTSGGVLAVGRGIEHNTRSKPTSIEHATVEQVMEYRLPQIARRSHVRSGNCDWQVLRIGLWAVLAMFAVLPLSRIRSRRRATRAGACPTCGYDLRATPDRCPECGVVPKKISISN